MWKSKDTSFSLGTQKSPIAKACHFPQSWAHPDTGGASKWSPRDVLLAWKLSYTLKNDGLEDDPFRFKMVSLFRVHVDFWGGWRVSQMFWEVVGGHGFDIFLIQLSDEETSIWLNFGTLPFC